MHVLNLNTSMSEFASVMANMRVWLDDQRISPDQFNHSSSSNRLLMPPLSPIGLAVSSGPTLLTPLRDGADAGVGPTFFGFSTR